MMENHILVGNQTSYILVTCIWTGLRSAFSPGGLLPYKNDGGYSSDIMKRAPQKVPES